MADMTASTPVPAAGASSEPGTTGPGAAGAAEPDSSTASVPPSVSPASVAVDDDGTITVSAVEAEAAAKAMAMIEGITADAEIGREYDGKVKRIMPFGAFVEILPGKEGLLHISEIDHSHVKEVEDVLSEGEAVRVKVLEIDNSGKIRLSRKALLAVES